MRSLFLALALGWLSVASAQTESRIFTNNLGLTRRGELVGVKGDLVTIRWVDGSSSTLKASEFCTADNAYFKEHSDNAPKAKPSEPGSATANEEPLPADALVIQAYIDGPSELRVKKGGIYWINGRNAKPGKLGNHNFPTYVGKSPWLPVWSNAKPRGEDKSNVHGVDIADPFDLDFKLLTVGEERDSSGIEKRDEIKLGKDGEEFSINIPDRQAGARWYKFALIPKKKP